MKRLPVFTVIAGTVAAALVGLTPVVSTAAPPSDGALDAYTATVTPAQLRELARLGHDVGAHAASGQNVTVDLVLSPKERDYLTSHGIDPQLARVKGGQTVKEFAAAQAAAGYTVWRSWDEPTTGIRDQLKQVAAANPQIAKLVKIGTTIQGRDILAVKLTLGAPGIADGSRPAVLYSGTQHAREWIATEVTRRLMTHYIDGWKANDPAVRSLLQTTELWFVPVANPDGYQFTFDHERLWRKNTRDINGDGQITVGDGVDLNRNFPNHWGYDEEGSSSLPSSETYRGTAAVSEPETVAMKGLLDRIKFKFQVNYHSNGQWLLYAEGWQIGTPTADDPIYYALSGNLDKPAIKDFQPGLSSDVLYVTNGETTDYAHATDGTLAWTPELSEGCEGCGFVFPDDDALVQAEVERNLPFADSVAKSAVRPDNPVTVTGIGTKPFYLTSDDPYKRGNPGADLTFAYSYGDPQTVAVIAKRSLGAVTAKWRVNGGAVQSAPTSEWAGGERYAPAATYYHQVRGVVTGTSPGDKVEVWFEGGGQKSDSFTYSAVSETGNKVLVVAAEDYTGASPAQKAGPNYLDYYLTALKDNGIAADVYDVDARGRTAPDALGVLSHYGAAVWYTGDDIITRTAGRGPGNADRLALDELFEFRAYLNEGGAVAYTSDAAGYQYGPDVGSQLYDPKGEIACNPLPAGVDPRRCLLLGGSGDGTNDILQYWFGGYSTIHGDGLDARGKAFDTIGKDTPFTGLTWGLNGGQSAKNQNDTMSYVATSGILPVEQYKQFDSWPASAWDKPGGPYAPHSGTQFVYSQIADISYKRLARTITVPAGGATLSFWTSYDTEPAWDHLFVEAHTVGQDDWTTLPDANGHTTTAPGDSCAAGWVDLHPQTAHYQTWNGADSCTSTGTTGSWNAASGSSNGWQQWSVNLGAYAGKDVEVSISYASDWAVQGLGVFLDDVTVSTGAGTTSFEAGLDGWTVLGAPPGSASNANDWERTDASGFPVGNSIATPSTVLMGFGIEGVTTREARAAVMGRVIDHLLR